MWESILHATHILDVIPAIVIGGVIFAFGPIVINWLMSHTLAARYQHQHGLHKRDLEKRRRTLSNLFTNIWRIVVVIGCAYYIFTLFFSAQALAPLFASAGIIGVAFGFGAQTLVKDFLTGVFIISENQFRVGDVIEIDGFSGTVKRISIRSTVLRDVDGNVHYFPNGMVQHVVNMTMGYSMARFTVSVSPDTDIDRAIKVINQLGHDLAAEEAWKHKILEAPSFSMISDFNAVAITLVISGKTQPSDQWSIVSEMRRRILAAFEEENIIISTPPTLINTSVVHH